MAFSRRSGRIKAHAFPVAAGSAAGRTVRRHAFQTLVLLVGGGPTALGEVAKHVTTGATFPIDHIGQSLLTYAEFLAPVVEVNCGRQVPRDQPSASGWFIAQDAAPVRLVIDRAIQVWPDLSRIEQPTDSTLRGLASPKLLELRELIGQLALAQGRKVVVFSQWRRMLKLAHWATRDQLARERVRAAFFTGEESQKRRTQNIVDFHDDRACRVLFATDAGGVGLNLQRAASACINIELPWNPAVLEQRIGRIYRLGQRRPIDIYNLVSEPGIESRIADLVGAKQALFNGLFDGTTDAVAFERSGSFLSRIERIVAPAIALPPANGADASVSEEDAAEREVDAVMAAGDESRDGPGTSTPGPEPAASAADIQRLISGLAVQRTAAGGLVIEAPPETATTLAALFSGMAQLLQAAALPTITRGDPGGQA